MFKKFWKIYDFLIETRTIGRFYNIDLKLHFTFSLMLLILFVSSVIHGETLVAFKNLAKYFILFGSVTIHEYCHCLVARKYGIGTKDILLTCLGGIARIDRDIENPHHELRVAWAGPLSNVIMGALAFVIYIITDIGAFNWITGINAGLFIFNMIPAYPMDGGRIFKAIAVIKKGRNTGTKLALYVAIFFFSLFIFGSVSLKSISLGIIGGIGLIVSIIQLKTKEDPYESIRNKIDIYVERLKNSNNPLEIYHIAKEIYFDVDFDMVYKCELLNVLVDPEKGSCGIENCTIKNCSIPHLRLEVLFNKAQQYALYSLQICIER